jgi:hypothetical protein
LVASTLLLKQKWALIPLVGAALLSVAYVNPIQVGFGDLRDGKAAKLIRAEGDSLPEEAIWASDDIYINALLSANAQPSLSGQQWVGPNIKEWRKIDPTKKFEAAWNRGAAFIHFNWIAPGEETVIEAPQLDVIAISIDPCAHALELLHVRFIVTGRTLKNRCLTERKRFAFGGVERRIYDVE